MSDARSGWITFSIRTPNYAVLPEASAIVVSIDADNNPRTGESGTELQLSLAAGEITLERWDGGQFVPDDLPTRARHRNAGNVVAIDLHVSELGNSSRFRFSLLSVDVNTAIQSVVAVDIAPDDLTFWRYALANKPALRLNATRLFAAPTRPRAGKPFAVNLAVTRSDTGRAITSGTVTCRVLAAGKPVAATGRVVGGAGRCAFVVPREREGQGAARDDHGSCGRDVRCDRLLVRRALTGSGAEPATQPRPQRSGGGMRTPNAGPARDGLRHRWRRPFIFVGASGRDRSGVHSLDPVLAQGAGTADNETMTRWSIRDLWGRLTEKKAMKPETRDMLLGLSGIYEQRAPNAPSDSAHQTPETPRSPSDARGDTGS